MEQIVAPLKRNDRGVAVANLQKALLFLIDQSVIQLSEQDRRTLSDGICSEQSNSVYEGERAQG